MSKNEKSPVLFVDDDTYLINLFRMMFRSKYNVFTARGGVEGLEIVKQHKVDVVISGQRMPQMMGDEMLAKVRKVSPHTVGVLLTGCSDLIAKSTINTEIANRVLNKPWDQDELNEALKECIDLAEKNKASGKPGALGKNRGSLVYGGVDNLPFSGSI